MTPQDELRTRPTVRLNGVRCVIVGGPDWQVDGGYKIELKPIGFNFTYWATNSELGWPPVHYRSAGRLNGHRAA